MRNHSTYSLFIITGHKWLLVSRFLYLSNVKTHIWAVLEKTANNFQFELIVRHFRWLKIRHIVIFGWGLFRICFALHFFFIVSGLQWLNQIHRMSDSNSNRYINIFNRSNIVTITSDQCSLLRNVLSDFCWIAYVNSQFGRSNSRLETGTTSFKMC